MMIEIKGIGFPNRGAELMLHAVLQQFAARGVEARFASETYTPFAERARFGLWQIPHLEYRGRNVADTVALLPRKLRKRFGIVTKREVDLVLDCSGFAYGDHWGDRKLRERLYRHLGRWRRQRVPLVLMPQALGPFTSDKSRRMIRALVEQAHRVYVRDAASLEHLEIAGAINERVVRMPDLTHAVAGQPIGDSPVSNPDVCIVPNGKVVSSAADATRDRYVELLAELLHRLRARGRAPYLLIHEGSGDRSLADEAVDRSGLDVPIADGLDALALKKLIGQSRVVVSSRFHGLVSALSQGVPAVALGWSHKYRELMQDYGIAEHDLDAGAGDVVDRVIEIVCDRDLQALAGPIEACAAGYRRAVEAMWDELFDTLPLRSVSHAAPARGACATRSATAIASGA